MKRQHALATAGLAALGFLLLAAPAPASAGLNVDSATVDGGATTTVEPGASVEVEIQVTATTNTDWKCTQSTIEGESTVDNDTTDFTNDPGFTETQIFNISAPAVPDTYDLTLEAFSNNACSGQSDDIVLVDAIVVEEAAAAFSKRLVSGPLTTSEDGEPAPTGCNIDHYDGTDAACTGFASGFDTGENDDGPIGVTLLHSQHYVFEIKITNNGAAGEIDGTVLADTLGADWDMDPIAEEDFEEGDDLDGVCTDATCDGTGFDGVILVSGNCSYELSQPDSASGPNPPDKQPEFLDIRIDDLGEDEMCTFLVFVATVENPGEGNDFFEPTDCRELEFTQGNGVDGDPIFDTFALNEGIKAFDGATGDRLSGPVESLQLTCNFPD